MNLIMIAGRARVGKTTLAKWIADFAFENGLRPVLLSFAGGLKKEVHEMGYTKEDNPEEYRKICQRIGMEKRAEDPDYWVKSLQKEMAKILEDEAKHLEKGDKFWESLVIVDDCRFMNELAFGREFGATQIFISSGKRKLIDEYAGWRLDPSEHMANCIEDDRKHYYDTFNWFIENDSSEQAFNNKIKPLLPVFCGFGADSHTDACECEVCNANRQDREVDIEIVIEQVVERMFDQMKEFFEGEEEYDEDDGTDSA
tara:strand:- start:947 stop:1714 length:768 start_codon:yes stop_codon:yes gene_type:complete